MTPTKKLATSRVSIESPYEKALNNMPRETSFDILLNRADSLAQNQYTRSRQGRNNLYNSYQAGNHVAGAIKS
jgi:hypothetical protein